MPENLQTPYACREGTTRDLDEDGLVWLVTTAVTDSVARSTFSFDSLQTAHDVVPPVYATSCSFNCFRDFLANEWVGHQSVMPRLP